MVHNLTGRQVVTRRHGRENVQINDGRTQTKTERKDTVNSGTDRDTSMV